MTYSEHNNGVLDVQPELSSSAGVAKLEGRPNAGSPGDAAYTVPAAASPAGNRQGVLRSKPAVLTHGA